jgi:hypothetical protein
LDLGWLYYLFTRRRPNRLITGAYGLNDAPEQHDLPEQRDDPHASESHTHPTWH